MKNKMVVAVLLVMVPGAAGAELFAEAFDAEGASLVLVRKDANAAVESVDYGNCVRNQSGTTGPVSVRLPEVPNRLPGSAPTWWF